MPKRRLDAHPNPSRPATRQELGPLRNLAISSLTLRRYREHASYFSYWITMIGALVASEADLDRWVQEYIEQLWDHNAGLSAAQDTLAGVQHFMRQTVRLKGAWKLLGVWRRREPPTRAHPMPEYMLLAMAMHALQSGDVHFCASLLIGFYAFLRTGEIVTLTVSQCITDINGHVILYLGQSKSGKRRGEEEHSVVDHPAVCTLLSIFLQHRHPQELVCGGEEHVWRRKFDRYLHNLGLSHLFLRPYSIRRGGATNALRNGQTMAQICNRGRWGNEKTARIYIQEAVSLLQKQSVTPGTHAFLLSLADEWCFQFLR